MDRHGSGQALEGQRRQGPAMHALAGTGCCSSSMEEKDTRHASGTEPKNNRSEPQTML